MTIVFTRISLPRNDFGIGIFNHIRSRISKPESGSAIARTMVSISELIVRLRSRPKPRIYEQHEEILQWDHLRSLPVIVLFVLDIVELIFVVELSMDGRL